MASSLRSSSSSGSLRKELLPSIRRQVNHGPSSAVASFLCRTDPTTRRPVQPRVGLSQRRGPSFRRISTSSFPTLFERTDQASPRLDRRTHATSAGKEPLARTPLYELHVENGAKFSPFAGYEMPLYYADQGHGESHHWVRERCGLFDVSHM